MTALNMRAVTWEVLRIMLMADSEGPANGRKHPKVG